MHTLNKLAVFDKSKKVFCSINDLRNISIKENHPQIIPVLPSKGCGRIATYCLLICSLLSFSKVNAQGVEVKIVRDVFISSFQFSQVFSESHFQWIRNDIELLTFISSPSEVMAEPSTQEKRKDSPKESNKAETGLEKQSEITQENIEHFKSSLIGMLLASLVMVPLGIIFSSHISPRILAKRKRWMKLHTLKAERFHRNNPNKYYSIPRKTLCQWLWF